VTLFYTRGHLSGTHIAVRLCSPTCASASCLICASWRCSRWGLPGRRITATPVRSYHSF